MVIYHHLYDSFTGGEIAPRFYGRVDLDRYDNSVRQLLNMTSFPLGGITSRTGTKHVTEVDNSANVTRLFPFVFSTSQAYALEFGNQTIRFFRNQGLVLSSQELTNGDFTTDLTGWTDNSSGTGASAQASGAAQLTGDGGGNEARLYQSLTLGISQYTITITTSAALTYKIGTTVGGTEIATGSVNGTAQTFTFTPSAEGAVYIELENANADARTFDNISIDNPAYKISSPWTSAQLGDIQVLQKYDTMYIVHKDLNIRKLVRTNHDEWSISEVELQDGPYLDINTTDTTLDPSSTTGSVTVVASAITGINNNTGFQTTDIGRLIRFKDADIWYWLKITARASTTSVTATYQGDDAIGHAATTDWQLGAFSETTGYPAAAAFESQRVVYGRTAEQPAAFWGSVAGDLENFTPDDTENEGVVDAVSAYTFVPSEVDEIRWLATGPKLFIGATNGVFYAQASSLDEAITQDNIVVKRALSAPVSGVIPVNVENVLLFPQFYGTKFFELAYTFESDGYQAADLMELSEHLSVNGITDSAVQEQPDRIVWVATSTGELRGLTYSRQQKVVGWHQHALGGTDAVVQSLTSIPGTAQDELWMIVSRTINGNTVQYVEFLSEKFDGTKANAWYVDSGASFTSTDTAVVTGITKASPGVVTTSGAHGYADGDTVELTAVGGMIEVNGYTFKVANKTSTTFELLNTNTTNYTTYTSGGVATKYATSISGLGHLEGETVSIYADEAVQSSATVTSGAITLARPVKAATIGLGYTCVLETNTLEIKGAKGTIQGSRGRVYEVAIRFHEALGAEYGYDASLLDTLVFRGGSDPMDSSPPLFTGIKTVIFPTGYEYEQRIMIRQTQPLPVTVLGLTSKLVVGNK